MWWLGALGAYLAIGFALCAGTLVALGLGIEDDRLRRQVARFAALCWVWPLLLIWIMVRGLRAAWNETGWKR